jgi:hypothetical protein
MIKVFILQRVILIQNVAPTVEKTQEAEEILVVVAVVAEEEEDLVEIENQGNYILFSVLIVIKRLKFHLSHQVTDQFIVASVLILINNL